MKAELIVSSLPNRKKKYLLLSVGTTSRVIATFVDDESAQWFSDFLSQYEGLVDISSGCENCYQTVHKVGLPK